MYILIHINDRFFRCFYSWKIVKGPILLYLESKTLVSLSSMGAGRRHDIPGSETKDFIIYSNSSSKGTSIFSYHFLSLGSNRKMCKGAGDMTMLNRFCYKNAEARKPDSGLSKRKAAIASVQEKCKRPMELDTDLELWLRSSFEVLMMELLL